ncbi:hypothetical protein [Pseudocitrobacter faecalis]|uniref:hypothetical protein n=1 Tax=Pseudocitrobacter faecalis TaxID=1398493 RepID=UPI00406443C1
MKFLLLTLAVETGSFMVGTRLQNCGSLKSFPHHHHDAAYFGNTLKLGGAECIKTFSSRMETLSEPRMGRLDGPVVDYQFSDVICLAYDRSSPEQSHPAANMVVDLVFANAGVFDKSSRRRNSTFPGA